MHVLHHRDRRAVLLVTALAAALAMIVTLALATDVGGGVSPRVSSGGRLSVQVQPSAVPANRVSSLLTADPFTPPLGGRIHLPWPTAARVASQRNS
jgi:hypothetical protein